jgi:DNA-binding transcriptional LysR family regulator
MFTRIPSPHALREFEAAARLGSFKAAAEELSVSPTAISHQIRKLEDQLGLALFTRGTRAVTLTNNGARLAEAVHEGFSRIATALEEIAGEENILTVTTTPAFATLWLAPRLNRLQDDCPGLRVRLESSTTAINLARDQRVDVAIRYGGTYPDALRRLTFPSEHFGAYGAPDLIARAPASLEGIALFETVWTERGLTRLSWHDWLARAGLNVQNPALDIRRFDQEHHVVQCGISGQGLILASSALVSDLVDRNLLAPYRPDITLDGMTYSLLATPDKMERRKVRTFITWIRDELGRGIGPGS